MIIFRQKKEYLKVTSTVWNNYLNKVSKFRTIDNDSFNCSLKYKNQSWKL